MVEVFGLLVVEVFFPIFIRVKSQGRVLSHRAHGDLHVDPDGPDVGVAGDGVDQGHLPVLLELPALDGGQAGLCLSSVLVSTVSLCAPPIPLRE